MEVLQRFWDWWCIKPNYRIGKEIYDIRTPEFHEKAKEKSGVEWDFSRLETGYRCCVKNCLCGRLYGHWTCDRHVALELHHFQAVNNDGTIFWSHKH